ncbi:3'-to-5' oligoribonuclease [Photobacterium aphoticum]|uniref:3'-to-5' oligoribonuclease n=1 Tax=Photobacterium aphoticum TaxID=754436 RepID=A0A090RK56_9GAMM|nr:3'-to-5' oligoribonuclease [Photobacterium aphoticum]
MTERQETFVWLDLETGGLMGKQENGQMGEAYYPILEVAVILTDRNLDRIGEPLRMAIFQEEDEIAKCDPWAQKTHEESGLLKDVRESGVTLADAEKQILKLLKKHGIKKFEHKATSIGILAGSSVHFDRAFIRCQMAELDKFLHYRLFDVSPFDIASRAWNPELSAQHDKRLKHEALADIEDSINEARIYRDLFIGKDRGSFRAGYERGASAGGVENMDQHWVDYRNA